MKKTSPRRSRSNAQPSSGRQLATYRAKRDFQRTPEPAGRKAHPGKRRALRFVVQKHASRSLHYDFRLELDGVLLSWSVPKGPSYTQAERRLAVRTEDHPLEYAGFEGVIPAGEYGGGTVLVWDEGTWLPLEDPRRGLRKGHLVFELDGQKLHGRWHLVRTRLDAGKRESWLLFKGGDEDEDDEPDIVRTRPESVLSGRTLDAVRDAGDRIWRLNRSRAGGKTADGGAAVRKPRAPATKAQPSAEGDAVLSLVGKLAVGFPLTHLDRVLYPEQGLRKAELIAYYASVAEWMLPFVANRPLTLVRCPEGTKKQCFFQKHITQGIPEPVHRIDVREDDGSTKPYMIVTDMPGLVALAQIGSLEIHTWVCHADRIERPDELVFDLDPDEGLSWDRVVEAALEMRRELSALGLESFVKTTGGKGLHVVAPVSRRAGWEEHKAFARAVSQRMATNSPSAYTVNARKTQRKGRLFLDYLRNARGATAVCAYSTRAREGATISTPVTWRELGAGVDPAAFTVTSLPKRLASLRRDPWAGYRTLRQSVGASAKRTLGLAR